MKKIVVIGNSIAGVKALEAIRAADQSSRLTLIPLEEGLPYDRRLLPDLVAQGISSPALFYKPEDHYRKLQVQLAFDQKVGRINFKKNRITTEDKQSIDYDFLIVTDTDLNRLPDIKGIRKSGVFCPRRLCDVNPLIKNLAVTDAVIMQSERLLGLKMACALKKRDKEVLWVIRGSRILPSLLDEKSSRVIRGLLEARGIRIIEDNAIDEVLGNGDVKAVRLKSGKVMAAQMVVFGDVEADLKLFKDSDLYITDQIPVNSLSRTNLDDVFALDAIADYGQDPFVQDYDTYLSILEHQGKIAAAYINACGAASPKGQETPLDVAKGTPVHIWTSAVGDLPIRLIGTTQEKEDIRSVSCLDKGRRIYKKIFTKDHRIVGAVLLNCEGEKEKIMRLLEERADIAGAEDDVLDEGCPYDQIIGQVRKEGLVSQGS